MHPLYLTMFFSIWVHFRTKLQAAANIIWQAGLVANRLLKCNLFIFAWSHKHDCPNDTESTIYFNGRTFCVWRTRWYAHTSTGIHHHCKKKITRKPDIWNSYNQNSYHFLTWLFFMLKPNQVILNDLKRSNFNLGDSSLWYLSSKVCDQQCKEVWVSCK